MLSATTPPTVKTEQTPHAQAPALSANARALLSQLRMDSPVSPIVGYNGAPRRKHTTADSELPAVPSIDGADSSGSQSHSGSNPSTPTARAHPAWDTDSTCTSFTYTSTSTSTATSIATSKLLTTPVSSPRLHLNTGHSQTPSPRVAHTPQPALEDQLTLWIRSLHRHMGGSIMRAMGNHLRSQDALSKLLNSMMTSVVNDTAAYVFGESGPCQTLYDAFEGVRAELEMCRMELETCRAELGAYQTVLDTKEREARPIRGRTGTAQESERHGIALAVSEMERDTARAALAVCEEERDAARAAVTASDDLRELVATRIEGGAAEVLALLDENEPLELDPDPRVAAEQSMQRLLEVVAVYVRNIPVQMGAGDDPTDTPSEYSETNGKRKRTDDWGYASPISKRTTTST